MSGYYKFSSLIERFLDKNNLVEWATRHVWCVSCLVVREVWREAS